VPRSAPPLTRRAAILRGAYYFLRGVGLAVLPALLADSVHPSMVVFIVVYGLDWVATVARTAALCGRAFGDAGTMVFGQVFASHQIDAAVASVAAGAVRDVTGGYIGRGSPPPGCASWPR
jgi:hypothetical protein